jgi:hypothetical protein
MRGLSRLVSLVGLAAALLMSSVGCSDYTYFNVNITLRQTGDNFVTNDVQREIAACVVFVRHDGKLVEPGTDLVKIDGTAACRAPSTPEVVGVMDYSTAKQSGTIEFVVNMNDTEHVTIVQGTTSAGVAPGKVMNVDLVAATCPRSSSNAPPSCPIDIK